MDKKFIFIDKMNYTKKINCEKEKKMRVETNTWNLTEDELSHGTQLSALNSEDDNKYNSLIISHIKTKIGSYKQQDILKKKFNESEFIKLDEVVSLLKNCGLKCCYCSNEVYLLYERVREMNQWSLDRINNDIGHNSGNAVIACLDCNLKRRRTNKDAFMFTKNMVITREGL